MTRVRHDDVTVRIDEILTAALKLSEKHGYSNITREQVATAARCSVGLVSKRMGTMDNLRRSIVSAAINQENLVILAQALVNNHPKALRAPQELRHRAAAVLGQF
jgi:AcrR family transcriptional regulator